MWSPVHVLASGEPLAPRSPPQPCAAGGCDGISTVWLQAVFENSEGLKALLQCKGKPKSSDLRPSPPPGVYGGFGEGLDLLQGL